LAYMVQTKYLQGEDSSNSQDLSNLEFTPEVG
jgi:hypothetical protein